MNKQHDGTYGLTTDWWAGHVEKEVGPKFVRLLQLYGVHKAMREARKKGLSVTGHAFFTEAIDLSAIGRLAINRATTIEFHNDRHVWEVKDGDGEILLANLSRSACLHWEHEHFNQG